MLACYTFLTCQQSLQFTSAVNSPWAAGWVCSPRGRATSRLLRGKAQLWGGDFSRRDILTTTVTTAAIAVNRPTDRVDAANVPTAGPSLERVLRVGSPDGNAGKAELSLALPPCSRPHIIAHRGASGYLPEHTLEAYKLAIDMGCDYIEPDLVMTKDGHLVCLHDIDMTRTTDVATHPELRHRRRSVYFDSNTEPGKRVSVSGYFTFDFTLEEIKRLRVRQRVVGRPTRFDGMFQVPTLDEVIRLRDDAQKAAGRPIGIYAEIKEPFFFRLQGLDIEDAVVRALQHHSLFPPMHNSRLTTALLPPSHKLSPASYTHTDVLPHTNTRTPSRPQRTTYTPPKPMVIQCFDRDTLVSLSQRTHTRIPLVQLLRGNPDVRVMGIKPEDALAHHLGREVHFGDVDLRSIAEYAHGIGPEKKVFTSRSLEAGRAIVNDAHAMGLGVHPWTFRKEALFVVSRFVGDSEAELRYFLEDLGVDGVFVEQPDQAYAVLQSIAHR